MGKKKTTSNIKQLQNLYAQGVNLTDFIKNELGIHHNNDEVIELSYDIMAGSYSLAMEYQPTYDLRNRLGEFIATEISQLCTPSNILDAGIGEASTLSMVLNHLHNAPKVYGFDLSWSRLGYAARWLNKFNYQAKLARAEMTHLPYLDNSFDVVFTSHAIEPNGGLEKEVLSELIRVTAGYLVMIEPDYELADEQNQKRMKHFGYCQNLVQVISELGFKVVKHEPTPVTLNPANPSSIYIVEVNQPAIKNVTYACPTTGKILTEYPDCYYSEEAMIAYPKLGNIPCLHQSDAIIASHFLDLIDK